MMTIFVWKKSGFFHVYHYTKACQKVTNAPQLHIGTKEVSATLYGM